MDNYMIMCIMVVISMMVISLVDAQTAPPCADQILPCMDYLNSTNPPDICCNPIQDMYHTSHETCFCQLATPGLLEGFGVQLDQAMQVVHACGVEFDVTSCKASSPAFSPSLVTPPATPGNDEGGADMITLSEFYFMPLFIWACVLFY
ncbi:non-specific lipid transfer protein GPI-anchored 9-like [Vicia villosa]|uniref:non-specific lipid transfer protein GPI-anchored 9-like n=1 Tax=Vicia villosa TaxID=3911 RepID=UPI00273BA4C7|nr:non-specific lipid transfer protein GPI-anchored 9-like [Vicia villosa]